MPDLKFSSWEVKMKFERVSDALRGDDQIILYDPARNTWMTVSADTAFFDSVSDLSTLIPHDYEEKEDEAND